MTASEKDAAIRKSIRAAHRVGPTWTDIPRSFAGIRVIPRSVAATKPAAAVEAEEVS